MTVAEVDQRLSARAANRAEAAAVLLAAVKPVMESRI
jgi:hypothetical protein